MAAARHRFEKAVDPSPAHPNRLGALVFHRPDGILAQVGLRPADEPIDAWIRWRLAETVRSVTSNLDRYEFGIAKGDVERFFWGELCDNYLEMIKARLYDKEATGRRAAQAGLHDVLLATLRLLTPYIPHVTETVYQALFRPKAQSPTIAADAWPEATDPPGQEDAEADGAAALAVVTAVRRWRTEAKVGAGKPLIGVRLAVAEDVAARLGRVREAVMTAARLQDLTLAADAALPAGDARLDAAEVAPKA